MSRRSLRLSLYDVFFFSIMVGVGESYLPAFALSVGMSETMAGFFASVPLVLASIIQLATPILVSRFRSVQRYVVFFVFLQAASFLPLIYFSLFGTQNFLILFLVATLYWGSGFAAGPAWNFWMGFLVPQQVSASYFSLRTRINQIGILLGLVGGGLALHAKISFGPLTSVFSILFLIAFLARASSSLVLAAKDYEPEWYFSEKSLTLRETIQKFWHHSSYRRFFGFLFLFYVSIFISSPFVSPFLLKKLNLDYFQYMAALAAMFLTKIMVLPFVPKLVKRFNIKTVFLIGAIGLSPLPAFWSFHREFWFVLCLQALSGIFWSLFEVSLTIIFFQQLKTHEKIPVLTIFNVFTSSALIIGAAIGGQVLHYFQESLQSYFMIFVVGSAIRLALVFYFERKVRDHVQLLQESERVAAPIFP